MGLLPGAKVDLTGRISDRLAITPADGGPAFVKARLHVEGGRDQATVVWWDAGLAPRDGARVRIQGTVRVFNNNSEVHVFQTAVEREGPPQDPLARIVGFYLECVEAETAGALRLTLGREDHVELAGGSSPLHRSIVFPNDEPTRRWCRLRQVAIGETLVAGWPLVVGTDTGSHSTRASPLLIAEAELISADDRWQLERLGSVDLNPYALDLLDIDRAERYAIAAVVERDDDVSAARTPRDRASAIVQVLRGGGVDGLEDLNPDRLDPVSGSKGIQNAGVVMATTGGMGTSRMLVEDLNELLNTPDLLADGPAAVLLGKEPAPQVPLPEPHPTIVPTAISQDQAIHSAMQQCFTVVTGPPGTGKSQLLVNAVAAAVANGETVLFASKNNRAVDVVLERLRKTSPRAVVVRAGPANRSGEVAQQVAQALGARPRQADSVGARKKWTFVKKRVRDVLGLLHERAFIEGEMANQSAQLGEHLDRLPPDTVLDVDGRALASALANALSAVDAFGQPLGLFGRRRRHQLRLEQAEAALAVVDSMIPLGSEFKVVLTPVFVRARRSQEPRRRFQVIHDRAMELSAAVLCQKRLREWQIRLGDLPQKHELEDRLHALSDERIGAGRELLDSRWEEVRFGDPAARDAANDYSHLIETRRRRARSRIPDALPALPVWAVTNLSARTSLPLKQGLFDLVIIDEASQCDVASALPILARGKRGLIIGDSKQLSHITSLNESREQVIAQRWGLGADQVDGFSYRSWSCFGLASSRVQASPIFLDLHFRSHPAIAAFANRRVYGGRLELCSDATPPEGLPAVEWLRVAGQSAPGARGRSRSNRDEAHRVAREVAQALPRYEALACSVGVVTPYRAQVEAITAMLSELLTAQQLESITVATAHRFQGDERDIMYFSPVVDGSMTAAQVRFAADPNLINVALTRARRRLIVVGDLEACLTHQTILQQLAQYTARLEAGAFDSPLELAFYEALLSKGITARTGVMVGRNRLDLAIEDQGIRLDVECDGAPFHFDHQRDAARDRVIEAEGWIVLRFSGRRLSRDLDGCVESIMQAIESGINVRK